MVAETSRGSHIFSDAPLDQIPPILVLNVVFGKLVPNPSCVPNLKLLLNFLDASLAQTPSNFGHKHQMV